MSGQTEGDEVDDPQTYADLSGVAEDATLDDIMQLKNPSWTGGQLGRNSCRKNENNSKRRGPSQNFIFPTKLHDMLSCTEFSDIITWLPHGRSWRIVDKKALETVIPKFFAHSNYTSFIRQVNGWGFKRITEGADRNSYYNEYFLRGMKHLTQFMKRQTTPRMVQEPKLRDFPQLPLNPEQKKQQQRQKVNPSCQRSHPSDVKMSHNSLEAAHEHKPHPVSTYPGETNLGYPVFPPRYPHHPRWGHPIVASSHPQNQVYGYYHPYPSDTSSHHQLPHPQDQNGRSITYHGDTSTSNHPFSVTSHGIPCESSHDNSSVYSYHNQARSSTWDDNLTQSQSFAQVARTPIHPITNVPSSRVHHRPYSTCQTEEYKYPYTESAVMEHAASHQVVCRNGSRNEPGAEGEFSTEQHLSHENSSSMPTFGTGPPVLGFHQHATTQTSSSDNSNVNCQSHQASTTANPDLYDIQPAPYIEN